jgi:hypothetical protein
MAITKTIFTGLDVKLSGSRPYVLAPLVTAVDSLHVALPGQQRALQQVREPHL